MSGKRTKIYGIGINDADYRTGNRAGGGLDSCPYYLAWAAVFRRCYSIKLHNKHPTYIGCTVDPEWHSFMAFRAWMIEQDWRGKSLDKDIIKPGNKIYGPAFCCFISKQINTMLSFSSGRKGKYPIGVYKRVSGRYGAQISVDGVPVSLGSFDTPSEASAAYSIAKSERIRRAACNEVNKRVAVGLFLHADLIYERTAT